MGKKEKAKIMFVGESASQVTGSSYLLTYKGTYTLLDCGYVQHRDKLKQYQLNNQNYKYKVKNLENILISHKNLDHYNGLPRLYANGCRAKIFIMKGGYEYLKIAFEDSFKIHQKDIEYLSKTYNKSFRLQFTEEDIQNVLDHIIEIDYNQKYFINEYMCVRFSSAYHIAQSAQIEVFINDKENNYNRVVYYSGDLGNNQINKPFLEEFKMVEKSSVAILECTYAMNIKTCNQKTRNKDIEKINTAVRETCIENDKTLLIGTFAFNRAQELLYELYLLYGKDNNFDIPIIIDSPLTVKTTKMFDKLIPSKDLEIWNEIMNWNNLHFVSEWDDSESARRSEGAKIVISASGFCDAGRIRAWLSTVLPDEKSMVVFVGFSDEGSLASEIKEGKKKYIKIDEKEIPNKAKVLNLTSFSSHIQHNKMLDLYSKLNTKEIYLVHGESNNKYEFAELLQNECSKNNNTTKIFVPMKDDIIEIK